MATTTGGMRKAFRTIHRWVAIALFVLLVPIAVSGALLVFQDEIDGLVHPAGYAVTGSATLSPSTYFASAAAAPGVGVPPFSIRYPEHPGGPVVAQARVSFGDGGRPRLITIYIDPPTARVLDVVEFRGSFFGFLHFFHENLLVPEYSGRAIVGWTGVAMLFLALSGIYLWWPRNGAFIPGLRWRRAPATTTNLHHLLGFWISLPLAFVCLSGIYLAFPPQARSLTAMIAPVTPPGLRPGFGPVLRQTATTSDQALEATRGLEPSARPRLIVAPTGGRDVAPAWRVHLGRENGELITLLVSDRGGDVSRLPQPLAGDRLAQWMRWLHEGSHSGVLWRVIVLLTGIFPAVLGVTGILMWLRERRGRRRAAQRLENSGGLQAAE